MIVWLSGPTGAGKTSIARLLGASGYSVVEEYVPDNLFRAFARHPPMNCEPLQRCLMQARANSWKRVMGSSSIVFDRSIDEDIEVFCTMHNRSGLLTPRQYESLKQLGATLQKDIPAPDLIVFVTADYDVLLRRIKSAPAPVVETLQTQILL